MGYAKERIMEEMEQSWKYKDDLSICDRCLYDPYLKAFVTENATVNQCSFCHRRSRKKPKSIKFDALMAIIVEAVDRYYGRTRDEPISWDSEDGRYIGDTLDTYDLIHYRIPPASEDQEVLSEIVDSLGDDTWCEHQPYALNDVERYEYSWEAFCKAVKHQTRYFFSDLSDWEEDEELVPVGLVLNELRNVFSSTDLIRTLPAGTKIFRGRLHDPALQCETWDALGPPPSQYAPSNRMSAAGIAMFYGAFDIRTIQAEVSANSGTEERRVLTIASWLNPTPLVLLDLTELPEPPSFYSGAKYQRDNLQFLQHFVESITQPVQHDGREHIDYVPTQVLTEYIRYRCKMEEDTSINGIMYPSAQHPGSRNVVIFADQVSLNPRPADGKQPKLVLVEESWKRHSVPPRPQANPRVENAVEGL